MDYLTTRGLVLRTTEYKETDRIFKQQIRLRRAGIGKNFP